MIRYRKLSDYDKYFNYLINERKSFVVETTNYTKKIKESKDKITVFNHEGDNDYNVLSLISMVRRDAENYLKHNSIVLNAESRFFDLSERPPEGDVCKIDIRGAYWSYAIQNGIISEKTNKFLEENYNHSKVLKSARLKALGSLATHKKIYNYVDGRMIEMDEEIQDTKELYMYICSGIDDLMKKIVYEMNGAFYYYWDCVFVEKKFHNDAVDFILKQKYHTKTEETVIKTVGIGNCKYLFSNSDEKMYLVRKDREFLLYNYDLFDKINYVNHSNKLSMENGNILLRNSNKFLTNNKTILLNEF